MIKFRKLLCALLCLLLLGAPLHASALGTNRVYIATAQHLLDFAENCRLDSYSRGLTVLLCCDIDLTGTDFSGIPTFSGTFDGRGYTISGLSITASGSVQGFFRYLTSTASVQNLHLNGTVSPSGSRSTVGGIAGSNAGNIENCTFSGSVTGADLVGGIVGVNLLTGTVASCDMHGKVHGNHFVGGIAGENIGVVRDCENNAYINTTVEQNDVELEDITLESITSSEYAATVTDLGGICGSGTGVIRDCTNLAPVGYKQIGYNIGGIAGSFSGYIFGCQNQGQIAGRKEVGGIIGQLEPTASIEYAQDTLQTLEGQMDDMSDLAGAAGAHAQQGGNALNQEAQNIEKQVNTAVEALDVLIPDEDNPELPDADAILAAQNALSSSLAEITDSLGSMVSISEGTIVTLGKDIQAITGQLNEIAGTIGTASENLGGSLVDVSDLDSPDALSSKVETCKNRATVVGDWNVGGIVGAVAFENDLDPESDMQLIGDASLNFAMELRAVILSCENTGTVQCKKQNAGGIAGWVSIGLLRNCVSIADVEAPAADYVGGIAGQSSGYTRKCSAKSILQGEVFIGGIAGSGSTVTDCRAIVLIESGKERIGSILGDSKYTELFGNYYFPIGADPGAVDGISYDGLAAPMEEKQFLSLEDLPRKFLIVRVQFASDNGTISTFTLPFGSTLSENLYHRLPAKEGNFSQWSGSIRPGDRVFFDTTLYPVYNDYITTLESDLTAPDGKPIALLQGEFTENATFSLAELELPDALRAWELTLPESNSAIRLRLYIPENYTPEELLLYGRSADGQWEALDTEVKGSYLLTASLPGNTQMLKLELVPNDFDSILIVSISAGILLLLLISLLALRKRKKKRSP